MIRNKFSLSHYKLLTMDMGLIIPIAWYEALPGDTIQQATSALIRVSPLLSPVMHPVQVRLHHWFVPNRLIWEDWEDFITGGPDGTSVPVHPHITLGTTTEGSLHDYFGVHPYAYSSSVDISALPFRAYQLIFNEYYRDQDLVTEATIDKTSGTDTTTETDIQYAAWEKDYFTTARPWEAKGTAITIPLGTTAPVLGIGKTDQSYSSGPQTVYETGQTGSTSFADYDNLTDFRVEEDPSNAGYPGIFADLSAASGIDLNDLRLALSLQRAQEARARYGSRYVEYLRYLGIKSSDGRLQNPEYLGGGRQIIQFSEVLQTAEGTDPVADMKGHGIAAMRSNRFRRYFEEHGIVMTLMSVIPKTIYNGNLYRGWSREVKEDYFQKELQHVGDQEVTNKEVYAGHGTPDGVFGYQARYDEYRHIPSSIAGEFRSTLDHWHYARIFSGDPALNSSFVTAVPTKRVYASNSTDCLYVMANHSIQARRLLTNRSSGKII